MLCKNYLQYPKKSYFLSYREWNEACFRRTDDIKWGKFNHLCKKCKKVVKGHRKNTMVPIYCVKSVRICSYSGPHFPAFGLNTERYKVSLHIQSKCGTMWTRIIQNKDIFQAVITTFSIAQVCFQLHYFSYFSALKFQG